MQGLKYCESEEELSLRLKEFGVVPKEERQPTSISGRSTEYNSWPDKLFRLLTKEQADLEKKLKISDDPSATRLWDPLEPNILVDANINDSEWHKRALAGSSTKYTFDSLIGMPACIETDDYSIEYTHGSEPPVLPTNQMGGASYVLIKPTHSSYEQLFFNCVNNSGAEKLTLEEYVKRQRAIIEGYDAQNNMILKHIGVILNLLYRQDITKFDKIKNGLSTASSTHIDGIIDDIQDAPKMNKELAKKRASIICMFPEEKLAEEFANVIRLPSFEKFLEINI